MTLLLGIYSKSIELAGKNMKQQGKNGIGLFNSTLMALQSKPCFLDIRGQTSNP